MKIADNTSRIMRRIASGEQIACSRARVLPLLHDRWFVFALLLLTGCTASEPTATVEGTLRLGGKPLNNCLVTFLPGTAKNIKSPHSTGLTDSQGKFCLRHDNQQEGAVVGVHQVVIQDLSVATGIQRRDHGEMDAAMEDTATPQLVRRSRVPEPYTAASTTPLSREVKPGHQVLDLDIP
ncbi:MAG TPA: hypothetical protein DD670_17980 [Planctomycetaceae bacterium]|nr:hypothetical protein [Planctomycetaceae bacterium]